MALFGAVGSLLLAGFVATLADLAGDPNTRGFTRFVFVLVALRAFGVSVTGLVQFGTTVLGAVPVI